jgi:hypothetical protein
LHEVDILQAVSDQGIWALIVQKGQNDHSESHDEGIKSN